MSRGDQGGVAFLHEYTREGIVILGTWVRRATLAAIVLMSIWTSPVVCVILVLAIGLIATPYSNDDQTGGRIAALESSVGAAVIGALMCFKFNASVVGFQFLVTALGGFSNNLTFSFGADGLSMVFLVLTLFTFPVCILSAWPLKGSRSWQFYVFLLAMEVLLILTFTTLDLFYFFIFFESLLIPMFLIILFWGARGRKVKAGYLFFLYTLFGSLIMLFGVLYLYLIAGSTNFFVLLNTLLEPGQQRLVWACFFMAFAVKMPLYPFHIWLPEAHVEAPTVGSMLLASLLLKLGGYGFLRFSLSMLSEGSSYFSPLVSTLALLGVVYGSLSTIRQIDMKRVIAYSSVAHMNLVMLGLFSNNQQGIEGAIYLMVAHGVVSTGLFFCIGVLYDRYHSRLIRYYGGLVTFMPLFSGFFFAFTLANMSFPGTSNFLGELLLFFGVFAQNSAVLLAATAGIILSAVYSVWLFNRVVFGTFKTKYLRVLPKADAAAALDFELDSDVAKRRGDINRRETAILGILLIAMLVLGVSANFILTVLHAPVALLLLP